MDPDLFAQMAVRSWLVKLPPSPSLAQTLQDLADHCIHQAEAVSDDDLYDRPSSWTWHPSDRLSSSSMNNPVPLQYDTELDAFGLSVPFNFLPAAVEATLDDVATY